MARQHKNIDISTKPTKDLLRLDFLCVLKENKISNRIPPTYKNSGKALVKIKKCNMMYSNVYDVLMFSSQSSW